MFLDPCAVVMLRACFVLPHAWKMQMANAGEIRWLPRWHALRLARHSHAWLVPERAQMRMNHTIGITMDRLTLLAPPASEPITLADAKLYLRVDDGHEDTLIEALIKAARDAVEVATGRSLISQKWCWESDGAVKALVLPLARGPVQAIDAVKAMQFDGSEVTLAEVDYQLLAGDQLLLKRIPAHAQLRVEYTAGATDATNIPAALVQAVRLLSAHYYAAREQADAALPASVAAMIAPFRQLRL
jgi:uncharacterized phiE125 gp8 family phage protein